MRVHLAATLIALLSSLAFAGVPGASAASRTAARPALHVHAEIGFRDREHLAQHYRKHGREFGSVGMSEYLRLAQTLRDRPAGGPVLEAVRADGVITRFDRSSGAFIAFDPDLTIRTFFRPNQGETYFRRQARRP
jgi:pyocin large subunit-like protein